MICAVVSLMRIVRLFRLDILFFRFNKTKIFQSYFGCLEARIESFDKLIADFLLTLLYHRFGSPIFQP